MISEDIIDFSRTTKYELSLACSIFVFTASGSIVRHQMTEIIFGHTDAIGETNSEPVCSSRILYESRLIPE